MRLRRDGPDLLHDVLLRLRFAGDKGVRPVPRRQRRRQVPARIHRTGLIPAKSVTASNAPHNCTNTPTSAPTAARCRALGRVARRRREFSDHHQTVPSETMSHSPHCHSERSEESLTSSAVVLRRTKKNGPSLAERGQVAFRIAVANVVQQHRQAGLPLAIWRNGKVVLVPAGQVRVPRTNR